MQSRTASRIKLGVVLILVVLIAVLGLSGSLRIGKYRFYPFADFLDPGLELGGGLSATYAATEATAEDAAALLESAESVLRARLDALELDEATVAHLGDGLRVETPAAANAEGDLTAIGATGQLQCLDSAGNVVLEGADLTSLAVSTVYDADGNPFPAVDFHPTDEAAQALAALDASETLSVYLDGQVIATVTPEQLSSGGVGFIPLTGYATAAEGARAAQRLAAILASGEMPLEMENTRLEKISPLLGENAGTLVSVAVLAALLLAIVGLIARYRLPGAAAALGVAIWALLTVIFLCELSFARMSLSGVAGVLTGLSLTAGGFALLLERCLRETRSYAPAVAMRRAWRSALPALTLGDVFPRRGRGEKLCRRAVHRRRLRAGGAGAPLPLPVGQRPASARKSVLPQNGSYGKEERPAAAAADRAGGAGRGGAGDAAVRRGLARRAGSWQRRGAALRPGRRIRA